MGEGGGGVEEGLAGLEGGPEEEGGLGRREGVRVVKVGGREEGERRTGAMAVTRFISWMLPPLRLETKDSLRDL